MRRLFATLLGILASHGIHAQCPAAAIHNNDSTHAVCIDTTGNVITIHSNNYPNHVWGNWPSNTPVLAQDFTYHFCAFPVKGTTPTSIYNNPSGVNGCTQYTLVGVALNGIFYAGWGARWFVNPQTQQENFNWNIAPSARFQMDFNTAHSNGPGEYHYHGVPVRYFGDSLRIDGSSHSPLVGYAADGFPIYYKYVYANPSDPTSAIVGLNSGYSLKAGIRPGDGVTAPDGPYDGLYVEDYAYSSVGATLDDCNGRFGVTPEYPNGTYYYVMTDNWPYFPRCFYGTVIDNSFRIGPNCPASTAPVDCSPLVMSTVEVLEGLELTLYPNPTSNYLTLQNDQGVTLTQISIYNTTGQVLYHTTKHLNHIDLSDLEAGTYFIQITAGEAEVTRKIIKR